MFSHGQLQPVFRQDGPGYFSGRLVWHGCCARLSTCAGKQGTVTGTGLGTGLGTVVLEVIQLLKSPKFKAQGTQGTHQGPGRSC